MKILMLTDVYFPRVNGVSSSIRTFAREAVRQGHSVTIVAPQYQKNQDDGEFEIIRLASRVIFFDPEDRLIRSSEMRAAAAELAARRWDIVHVHTPFRAHQLGVWLGKQTDCPVVESYHTYFEEYASHYLPWLPAPLLRFAARWFSRRLCHSVDHLFVPTEQMAGVLRRYGITTPASIIPTGIHLDEFRGGDGGRFRREHDIDPARPTIVTVSRLAAEKNIGFLLEVAWALVAEFPTLLFIIAGEGPDVDRLKQRTAAFGLENNVLFVGNLDRRTRLLDCYKAGDVFVFASPTETQGLVLLEAMALSVPIVSTAVMGTATVLAGTRSARVSEPNVGEFAEHIAQLLRSPQQRQILSAASLGDVAAWSAPVLMELVLALYAKLSAHQRALAEARAS
ncbi:MAG TPA: glycosyltransferase [Rudaea sp.]|jgi:glycosyltransferase involved in cell wall biosynthesis